MRPETTTPRQGGSPSLSPEITINDIAFQLMRPALDELLSSDINPKDQAKLDLLKSEHDLLILENTSNGWSVKDLESRGPGLSLPSCHRLVGTLKAAGLVEIVEGTQPARYRFIRGSAVRRQLGLPDKV